VREQGEEVRWQRCSGVFRRHVGDGEHAEIASAARVYRVRIADLR
jgi:hypothetical protein